MTEQQQTPPAGQTPPPEETKTKTSTTTTADAPKKYAAYDTTYLRFVGGVHDTKKAATDEAKSLKVKKYEIREV